MLDQTVTLFGRTFKAQRYSLGMRWEVEKQVAKLRREIMAERLPELGHACERMPENLVGKMFDAAMAQIANPQVSSEEIEHYLSTTDGRAYALWLRIRECEPEFKTFDAVLDFVRNADLESVPAETESVPAETESAPAETESAPAETESATTSE